MRRWIDRWGAGDAAALVEANNLRPELFLRPLGLAADDAVARLAAAGIEARGVAGFPGSLRVEPPAGAREALAELPAVVQDPAASLVVDYAAVPQGAVALDLCAAPGGKALGLAERAGFVGAVDLSFGRLRRIRENVNRVEAGGRVGLVVADARMPPFRRVDAVLVDAPCTGTGTFRRHPDARWRLQPGHLVELAALQREILDAAAPLVRPGGLLVYATCSLEAEENEDQVAAFLERHPEFRPDPAREAVDDAFLTAEGSLAVLPQRSGVDGSFAARLRRVA